MGKDFEKWHGKKSHVDKIERRPFFHEREIWFCHVGLNVGFEEDGKGEGFLRPVVIIRKFNKEIFWAIPLTKTDKNTKYYFRFSFGEEVSVAILSQIRLFVRNLVLKAIGTEVSSLRVYLMAGGQYFFVSFLFNSVYSLRSLLRKVEFRITEYEEECRRYGRLLPEISCLLKRKRVNAR